MNSGKLINKIKSFTHKPEEPEVMYSEKKQLELSYNATYDSEYLGESNIPIDENDACVTFLNSAFSMELPNIWKTPYFVGEPKNYREESPSDGLI